MLADLGDFYRKTRAGRKIIVVDPGFRGHSVQLMPTLRELKQNYSATSPVVGADFGVLHRAVALSKATATVAEPVLEQLSAHVANS